MKMDLMINRILLLLLSLIFLCGAVYFFLSGGKEQVAVPLDVEDKAQFEQFWIGYIKTHTAAAAYEKFKSSYGGFPPTDQHMASHLFGGALYNAEGLEGLIVCDMFFSSGCFHEFIGRALHEHGEGILKEMDTYCKTTPFDCQHGIGHGLVTYSGYDYEDLLEALDLCNELGSTDVRDGCFGGVFMEYNIRVMLEPEAGIRTQEKTEAPDALCLRVPSFSQQACYFWLAQWLLGSEFEGSVNEKLLLATPKCQMIIDVDSRLNCYSGMANELPSYTDDRAVMAQFCNEESLQAADPLFEVQCKSGVASSLFMDTRTRDEAPLMCDGLTGNEYAFCDQTSRNNDGRRIVPYTQWESSVEQGDES
jgi:hypothetical protein